MPDDTKIVFSSKIDARQSWSQESLPQEKIIRKVINPAIYVEKPLPYMPPQRKTSPLSVKFSEVEPNYCNHKNVKNMRPLTTDRSVKRCTCISNPELCQCHPSDSVESKTSSDFWEVNSVCSSSSADTQITVKATAEPLLEEDFDEMKLSLTSFNTVESISTDRTVQIDPQEKEERIKQWLKKKELQLKQKKIEEEKLLKQKELQKQREIEQKKEVHQKWLQKKKIEEDRMKRARERLEEARRKEEEEKLKKQKEGEEMYQAWLKIKKKAEIEKKLSKKMDELRQYEDKKKRLEENERAFHEWLKSSKGKPKPVPLNNGLSSLCASASVTYINPEPWVSNLEPKSSHQVQTVYYKPDQPVKSHQVQTKM